MSDKHFTFNFNAPVGQSIANVEKMEVHMDKDGNIQVMNAEQIATSSSETPKKETPQDKVSAAIVAVNEQVHCEPSDWAALVAIMEDKGKFPIGAYSYDAETINRVCGHDVTSDTSIARSIFFTKVAGKYPCWRIKQGEETLETPNKLSKYMEIGRITTQILEA